MGGKININYFVVYGLTAVAASTSRVLVKSLSSIVTPSSFNLAHCTAIYAARIPPMPKTEARINVMMTSCNYSTTLRSIPCQNTNSEWTHRVCV